MERMSKTTQKRVTKVNDFLLKTFKTTTDLNSSLKKERVLPKNQYLESGKKSLEMLNKQQPQTVKEKRNKEQEAQYLLEAEVKNLEHYKRAEPNEKIAKMIREQKDKRRERHFSLLNEYEKLVEGLYKDVDGEYEAIKEDVSTYYRINDSEINDHFQQFTDKVLLELDKNIIFELKNYISRKSEQRGEKILNLLGRLTDVEHEREKSMVELLGGLKDSLIDNAYFLKDQVEELIKEEEVKYEEIIQKQKEINEQYVDEVNDQQRKTFEKFELMAAEVEKRWRKLHHDETLRVFRKEIVKEVYTNPPDRNATYHKLKQEQLEIFERRKDLYLQLAGTSADQFKKSKFEKMLESLKELYDVAQAKYDKRLEELLILHNNLESTLKHMKEDLKERLLDIDAELEEGTTVETIIEGEVQETMTNILVKDKATLSAGIACIEENDLKANELITNLINFYIKLGAIQDTSLVSLKKLKFDYELEKAKEADDNDEKIEQLNEQLVEKKTNIREAIHHPKLEDYLKEGFVKLDEIEQEYRGFHDKNLSIVEKHPSLILNYFQGLEKELAGKFDLVDESKREEIQAKYQKEAEAMVTKLLEEEERKRELEEQQQALAQAENAKGGKKPAAKPPAKKDPKKQQKEMEEKRAQMMAQVNPRSVQLFDSPLGTQWLYFVTLEEFTREFFCVKEEEDKDKDKKSKPTLPEVEAPKPEEKKEEKPGSKQQAKKDSKAPPAKPDAKKKDDKKEEVKVPTPEEEEAARKKEEEEKAKYFTEWKVVAPTDLYGNLLLSEDVLFTFPDVCGLIKRLMQNLFDELGRKRTANLQEGEHDDKEFIENSMILLDQRLKAHYPLKGRLETEVYQIRASEIVEHKKRYERHVRTIIEKLDNQTEEFNFILEEGVESLKVFEQEQKELREALYTAESISRMDGIQSQAKDKSIKFGENNAEIANQLRMLTTDETNRLLQFNRDFIKNLQLFQNGGNFSPEEVAWYDEMLKEIDDKIKVEAEAREKRLNEVQELLSRKKQTLTTQFEGEYVIALEELCAKNGTGKKYGKPKRVAQEKLRTEMNKCERSQEAINKVLSSLEQKYESYKEALKNNDDSLFRGTPTFSIGVRKDLMALRSCITRYSVHIEAIKAECPVQPMPRVGYIEERMGIALTAPEVEEDNKRKEEELELLGPLYYQKDNKKFMELILEIEASIKVEAQKLYTDKNAKFLTGTDKIPDYLRTYLEGVRRQMEEFRISSCRSFRESCMKLSDMAEAINEMVFGSIKRRYLSFSIEDNRNQNQTFDKIAKDMEAQKDKNTKLLRPNLSNPACKEEFEKLNAAEKQRLEQYLESIQLFKTNLRDSTQKIGNQFFKIIVNNFEFLILYYDRLYLFEDFNRLPGDEEIQKKRADLKTLIQSKRTGVVIDRTTERCIEKKWAGIPLDSFMLLKGTPLAFDEDELLPPTEAEVPQQKGAAGGKGKAAPPKKEEKKGKDDKGKKPPTPDVALQGGVPKTRDVPSFKTFRQKTCYQNRNKAFEDYSKYFNSTIGEISEKFDSLKENEMKYQFQWEKSIDEIFSHS